MAHRDLLIRILNDDTFYNKCQTKKPNNLIENKESDSWYVILKTEMENQKRWNPNDTMLKIKNNIAYHWPKSKNCSLKKI